MGTPISKRNGKYWYKSPFRAEERTASFCVSEKGFYDFGTSEYYDVIEFIKKICNCDFKMAISILKTQYGITSSKYETNEIARILNEQREHNKRYIQKVEKWYTDNYGCICKYWRVCCDYKDIFKGQIQLESYAIILDVLTELDCLIEQFQSATTFKEKECLYQKRGEVTKWLRKD